MTRIEQVRQEMKATKTQVQKLIGLSDEQYGSFQYNQGIDYLKSFCGSNASDLVEQMIQCKQVWSWWRIQWHKRDLTFLEESDVLFSDEYLTHYMEVTHSIEDIEYWPHQQLLDEAYHKMIHLLVKKEVKQ